MYSTVLIQEDWNTQPFSVVRAKAALSPQLFLLRPWVLVRSGAQTLNPLQGSLVLSNLSQQATSYGSLNILCYVTIFFSLSTQEILEIDSLSLAKDYITSSLTAQHIWNLRNCTKMLKLTFKLNQTTTVSLSPCAKGFVHHYHKVLDQHHIW